MSCQGIKLFCKRHLVTSFHHHLTCADHVHKLDTCQDMARLSPLIHEHINMLGRYLFAVPDAVARGELRPLRDPKEDT